MTSQLTSFLQRWLTALTRVYFTLLFGWAAAYFLSGDRYGPLSLINTLALYLFLPLPFILPFALVARRRDLWLGLGAGAAIFLWLWGGLFAPKPRLAQAGGPALTVMTYNTLGLHPITSPAIDAIRAGDADVVFIQELNTFLAQAIQTGLADEYPYQVLDPVDNVTGMGTLSKYPLRLAGEQLPLDWVGKPQVFEMDWNGETVTLINFHMWATGIAPPEVLTRNYRDREAQALALAGFANRAKQDGPVIAAGDANTTSLNTAYKIVASALTDSWSEAGFGFGHTFPGSDIPGSARPRLAGRPVPQWLVRIDYVFHSDDLMATEARLAQFDGVSDHRGVVVKLAHK